MFHRLKDNEVPLILSSFGVQIHDLSSGLFSKTIAKQFENFIGSFLEYHANQISRGFKNFLRIHVQLDVRIPLKRGKKNMISLSNFVYAKFRYEKLTMLGH